MRWCVSARRFMKDDGRGLRFGNRRHQCGWCGIERGEGDARRALAGGRILVFAIAAVRRDGCGAQVGTDMPNRVNERCLLRTEQKQGADD